MSLQPSSIITQLSNDNDQPLLLSDQSIGNSNSRIRLDLRGTVFDITREELMRLPESILLGISNGLLVDNPNNVLMSLSEVDAASVNFSPECLRYTLDVFGKVATEVPPTVLTIEPEEGTAVTTDDPNMETVANVTEVLRKRPAIIVLREDLDYYCLPDDSLKMAHEEMQEIKRSCGEVIVNQRKVFSGLRKGDQPGSAEKHLIGMLCSR